MLKGGLQGLKRTRNPLKLPSNTIGGFKVGLARGVKRKAEEVLKQEITKQAKKALSNSNMKKALHVANTHFPKQVKKVRDIFGVNMPMTPMQSHHRRIHSDCGLHQLTLEVLFP